MTLIDEISDLTLLGSLISDGVLIAQVDTGKILSVNDPFLKASGYNKSALLENNWLTMLEDLGLSSIIEDIVDHLTSADQFSKQIEITTKSGQKRDVNLTVASVSTVSDTLVINILSSVEGSDSRYYRVLNAVNQCLQNLSDTTDLVELTKDICKTIVDEAHESMVWVGLLDFDDLEVIRPIASAGAVEGLFDDIEELTMKNSNLSTVMEYGESLVIQDIHEEESPSIWTFLANELDLKSILLVPLQTKQFTFGILSIFSDQPSAYPTDIIGLYDDLSLRLSEIIVQYIFDSDSANAQIPLDLIRQMIHDLNNMFTRIIAKTTKSRNKEDLSYLDKIDAEIVSFTNHLEQLEDGIYEPYQSQETSTTSDYLEGDSPLILIVDDDFGSRQLLKEVLKSNDFRLLMAKDGTEALRYVNQHNGQLDLVITDIIMPGIGGIELADEIHEKYADLKVMFISGHQITPFVADKLDKTESPFLAKPFKPSQLLEKVESYLDQSTQ